MSTANSSKSDDSKKTDDAKPKSGKKSKSTGFIESSGFKPTWLETGPLSPDMLPDPILIDQSLLTSDEFAALQEELQRLYGQEESEEADLDQQPAARASDAAPPAQPVEVEVVPDAPEPDDGPPPVAESVAITVEPETVVEPVEAAIVDPEALSVGGQEVAEAQQPENTHVAQEPTTFPAEDLPPLPPTERDEGRVEEPRTARPRRGLRFRRNRSMVALLALSVVLFALAALIYFVNPFTRLALGMASLARPSASAGVAPPRSADQGAWCLQGDFLDNSADAPRLFDDGTGGDILAGDGVYSLEYELDRAGTYQWQVVNCADASLLYPAAPAWIALAQPGPVTFVFDSTESADRLFFPIPFVVSAIDGATDYRIIGSFQEWNPDDRSGRLEPLGGGLYQQVRRIARPGNYEGYVIAEGDPDLAIDAYGRATEPIPFSFETSRNGDYVIFLVDIDQGRASVMYDMPPLITALAFGSGYRWLSLALSGLALLLLLGLLARALILSNPRLQLEAGCPRCGEQELLRIARRGSDRFLHRLGFPVYRYRCRHCTWEGARLSDEGKSVSPGASITHSGRFS